MINLLFTDVPGPASLLIRLGQRYRYTHVDVILPGGAEVIGAKFFRGVHVRPIKDALARARIMGWASVDVPHPEVGYTWARSQVGAGYDYLALAGIGLSARRVHSTARFICSEFAALVCHHAGLDLFHEEAHMLTPRDLWIHHDLRDRREDACGPLPSWPSYH